MDASAAPSVANLFADNAVSISLDSRRHQGNLVVEPRRRWGHAQGDDFPHLTNLGSFNSVRGEESTDRLGAIELE
ncbi:hypothetical protein ACFSUH_01080 [Rhodococcus jostii]|uniref:hypothetical protein n=1 Tax=Rhodococcus jostii TaxID=132919 RepID=UPI0011600592|nr:hypothetical protein [Rhodococcus jostii]